LVSRNWWHYLANQIIAFNCNQLEKRFWADTANLKLIQHKKLMHYIKKNNQTKFGKLHHFDKINSYQDYCTHVPLTNYHDYQAYIEALLAGEKNQLTQGSIKLLEPTSGTSSANKLIPYNSALQREFMAGVKPWLADLYHQFPLLKLGKSYWSVSPIETESQSEGCKLPIGFADDNQYFGWLSTCLDVIHVVPSQVRQLRVIENFRYITCLKLLATADLTLISVWNPSFFTIMMDYCITHQELLIKSLVTGQLFWPEPKDRLPKISIKSAGKRATGNRRID